jgi:AcrR family transcriptional regulator
MERDPMASRGNLSDDRLTARGRRSYDASRRQADAVERRRRVVDAAHDLFLTEGYGATSINEIARAADVSPQMIYASFGSKAGILAKLADSDRALTMTELADGVVYSRSGLTHQAGLLEKAGLITRAGSPDDQRATVVSITKAGRARVAKVLPGHIQVVRDLLFDSLSDQDVASLGDVMSRARDHMRARPPRSAAPRSGSRTSSARGAT